MTCSIDADGLRYAYPNGREALRGVSLRVGHGERVALLGPNGAGKTTLLLHLNALLHRSAGDLEVTGLDVNSASADELRRRVGLVFQDPDDQLFMPTVAEDVAFGPRNLGLDREEVSRRVREALLAVRMLSAGDVAPYQLSAGERRRVAIATVLAMSPSLLALDEPSANLDPRGRRELIEVLTPIDRTMLLATHDLVLAAEFCERTLILNGGVIVADGPTIEILTNDGLLHANDLELPAGFSPEAVSPIGKPAASR